MINAICPRNPQRFLFWKWDGFHVIKATHVCKFPKNDWDMFKLLIKCAKCDRDLGKDVVFEPDLRRYGIDARKLDALDIWNSFIPVERVSL